MKKPAWVIVSFFWLSAVGCTKYQWGGYDKHLLSHFQKPDIVKMDKSLTADVHQAENAKKVPPGLYAELGYVKYEQGRYDEAVSWFEKEKALWPESTVLMDKMIRNAKNGGKTHM
jgi:hypothetical protein